MADSMVIGYDDATHKYTVDGEVVPSVTQILDKVLPKPALAWWSFRIGMGASIKLLQDGHMTYPEAIAGHVFQEVVNGLPLQLDRAVVSQDAKGKEKWRTIVEDLAMKHKLHPNAIRDTAATRGTSIHDALAAITLGDMPKVADYPPEDRPFITGMIRWWLDQEPEFVHVEQIVASKTHGYAGRFDLMLRYPGSDGLVLADLKTGKAVRPDSHFRQLKAYELAWIEMGYEPPVRLEVLHVGPDGEYAQHRAAVSDESWLATVAQFRAMKDFEKLNHKRRKRTPGDELSDPGVALAQLDLQEDAA